MKKNTFALYSLSLILVPIILFNIITENSGIKVSNISLNNLQKYDSLLSKFQEESLGNSLEPSLKPQGPYDQPMTYGLILSAESIHYKASQTKESEEIIRSAAKWLINNADLNRDGLPGWGLPQSWDAFSDGTTNPENNPYSITTSIVLEGFLDSLKIENFWSIDEETEIKELLSEVALYWLRNVYFGDEKSGYIGYSIELSDMYNCPNISGMFLCNLARMVNEHNDIFNPVEKQFVINRIHAIAYKLIDEVIVEDGTPYWEYIVHENSNGHAEQNDLIHHIYVLWGIEEYRKYYDKVEIPFTLSDSIKSVDNFLKDDKIYRYTQNKIYTGSLAQYNTLPANLWGTGMMLAFYSKYGNDFTSDEILNIIEKQYGYWPNLTLWPTDYSKDTGFYGRYTSHVLFGLSYKIFHYKNHI